MPQSRPLTRYLVGIAALALLALAAYYWSRAGTDLHLAATAQGTPDAAAPAAAAKPAAGPAGKMAANAMAAGAAPAPAPVTPRGGGVGAPDAPPHGSVGQLAQGGSPPSPTPGPAAARRRAATGPGVPTPKTAPTTQPEEMVAMAFRDMGMDQIAQFISDKTHKVVIPLNSVRQIRVTIVYNDKVPVSQALLILREALRQNGVILEEYPGVINIRAITDARQSNLPVLQPQDSLAKIADKSQVVDKIFQVQQYDVLKLKDVVVPMLPDFGHVVADPNTRRLVVTDTVGGLERIEKIISALDISTFEQSDKKIIQIKFGDAAEIVSLLKVLVGPGGKGKDVSVGGGAQGGGPGGPGRGMNMQPGMMAMGGMPGGGPMGGQQPGGGGPGGPGGGGGATAVTLEGGDSSIVLVPEVTRNWIIVVAPPAAMAQVEEWIKVLDKKSDAANGYEIMEVKQADINEIGPQIMQTIEAMPDTDMKSSIRVVPFIQSHKLLVAGSARGRELIRDLLAQLDVSTSQTQMPRVFQLKYADAEQIKTNIEDLFSPKAPNIRYFFGDYHATATSFKVTADMRRNTVTVIADQQVLEKVSKLIETEWDLPVEGGEAQPRIYVLKHIDPVKLKDLLSDMFSKKEKSFDIRRLFWGDDDEEPEVQPVGRLFGQFTFQTLPDSNRLVVMTKNQSNYEVIDKLIEQLDQPEDAGVPIVVELKHANAEELAEQLNASLAESGTLAEIERSERDLNSSLSQSPVAQQQAQNSQGGAQGGNNNPQGQGNQQNNPNMVRFWWANARPHLDERPSSNLIGKIRFVPINRRNALLIIAPQSYMEPIRKLVEDLDHAGTQVLIHAVVAEVQHEDLTTLGVRLASDPSILNTPQLFDQSIGGSTALTYDNIFGGMIPAPGGFGGSVARGTISNNVNVNVLIQLLMEKVGMKILLEPKVYTSDNQMAEFFDGQWVPYQSGTQSALAGESILNTFQYAQVGNHLRVRPHITTDGHVDLRINLEISTIDTSTVLGNPVFDSQETASHVVVMSGQTVMLSGIVHQETDTDVRKLPLLGDLPLMGGLFRSTSKTKLNSELIVFVTPVVINSDTPEQEKMKPYLQSLERMKKSMGTTTQPADKEK